MRICLYNLTAGYKSGGLETFTWGLAEALAATKNEVTVVAGVGPRTSSAKDIQLLQFPYVPRERFPNFGTRFRKLAERISFARNAIPCLKAGGFDVVLINKPYDFVVLNALKYASFPGVTAYNSGGIEFFSGDRWLSKAVDLWLPCSEYNASRVAPHYGAEFTVLYNGVDTDLFSPEGPCMDLKEKLKLPHDAQIVMSVGRLIGSKGNHVVAEAIREIDNAHFVIIGAGPEQERLKQLAQESGLATRVHLLGEIQHKELPPYLRAADVFVQPAIGEEAFGISLAEAMACGLPVVASNAWGLREVVHQRESGLLAKPADITEWSAALRELLECRDFAAEMGRNARARVLERFTWKASADVFLRKVEQQLKLKSRGILK